MIGEYILLQFLLWFITVGVLSAFDYLAKKRLGVAHRGYINLRLPKFIALAISSIAIIASVYGLSHDYITAGAAGYLAIPYFAALAYFIAGFFREIKALKEERGLQTNR